MFKSKHNVNTYAEKNVQIGGTNVENSSKTNGVAFDQTLLIQAH